MHATDIVAYVYAGDLHCPECAWRAYRAGTLDRPDPREPAEYDDQGLPEDLHCGYDPVDVLFADETRGEVCGDCGGALVVTIEEGR